MAERAMIGDKNAIIHLLSYMRAALYKLPLEFKKTSSIPSIILSGPIEDETSE